MDTTFLFNIFLIVMAVTALIVFIALYFVNAGYGMFFDKKWGLSLSNRIGWILMEAPVFVAMIFLWIFAPDEYRFDPVRIVFLLLFQLHYFQRSFIFPFLIIFIKYTYNLSYFDFLVKLTQKNSKIAIFL